MRLWLITYRPSGRVLPQIGYASPYDDLIRDLNAITKMYNDVLAQRGGGGGGESDNSA